MNRLLFIIILTLNSLRLLPQYPIAHIECYRNGASRDFGSGFFLKTIDDEIVLITANHLVTDADSISVNSVDSNTNFIVSSSEMEKHPTFDIACYIFGGDIPFFKRVTFNLEFNDPIDMPILNSQTKTIDVKHGFLKSANNDLLKLSKLKGEGGDSGSPLLFDESLVGMYTSTAGNEGAGVPIDRIIDVLNGWDIKIDIEAIELTRIVENSSTSLNTKIEPIKIQTSQIAGSFTGRANVLSDGDLGTFWRSSKSEMTNISFSFDNVYSVTEIRVFVTNNDQFYEDMPISIYLKVDGEIVSRNVSEFLIGVIEEIDGNWVVYRCNRLLVGSEIEFVAYTYGHGIDGFSEVQFFGFKL